MSDLVKILDFGSSLYQFGFGGDTEPYQSLVPVGKKNQGEFRSFINQNLKEENQRVILLEKNFDEKRDKMVEMVFEHFQAKNLFIAKNASMGLYAIGRSTGLVLENSESSFDICFVEDGHIDEKMKKQANLSLQQVINGDQMIRQRLAANVYTLPDNQQLDISEHITDFKDLLSNIKNQDLNKQREILLLGRGFRINKVFEPVFKILKQKKFKISNLNFPNFDKNASFLGSSILSQIKTFDDFTINKQQYQELGYSRVKNFFINQIIIFKNGLWFKLKTKITKIIYYRTKRHLISQQRVQFPQTRVQ